MMSQNNKKSSSAVLRGNFANVIGVHPSRLQIKKISSKLAVKLDLIMRPVSKGNLYTVFLAYPT